MQYAQDRVEDRVGDLASRAWFVSAFFRGVQTCPRGHTTQFSENNGVAAALGAPECPNMRAALGRGASVVLSRCSRMKTIPGERPSFWIWPCHLCVAVWAGVLRGVLKITGPLAIDASPEYPRVPEHARAVRGLGPRA